MKIKILNTGKFYHEMMALPDNERDAFFDEKFLEPFAPMFEQTRMPRNPDVLTCLAISGADSAANDMLNQLVAVDAWNEAALTIANAAENLQNVGIEMLEEVTLGIFLGDLEKLAQSEGYIGSGSMPGYIQIIIAPNAQNIVKLSACIATSSIIMYCSTM